MDNIPGGSVGENRSQNRRFEPDKFDGKRTEWSDYLQHFETVAEWNGWSYEEKRYAVSHELAGSGPKGAG